MGWRGAAILYLADLGVNFLGVAELEVVFSLFSFVVVVVEVGVEYGELGGERTLGVPLTEKETFDDLCGVRRWKTE